MTEFSFFNWSKKEMMWVAGILIVIIVVSANQLVTGQMKTRDAQRKSDLELVARAMDKYYSDYKIYPAATEKGEIIGCGSKGISPCVWGNDLIVDKDNIVYLKNLPTDPYAWKGQEYRYTTSDDRQVYRLYTRLEYSADPVVRKDLTEGCGNNVQCNWYVESK